MWVLKYFLKVVDVMLIYVYICVESPFVTYCNKEPHQIQSFEQEKYKLQIDDFIGPQVSNKKNIKPLKYPIKWNSKIFFYFTK